MKKMKKMEEKKMGKMEMKKEGMKEYGSKCMPMDKLMSEHMKKHGGM